MQQLPQEFIHKSLLCSVLFSFKFSSNHTFIGQEAKKGIKIKVEHFTALHNRPHTVNKLILKLCGGGSFFVVGLVRITYLTMLRYCSPIFIFVHARSYVWIQLCRQVQACVFHSMAKLNYQWRCVFGPEK